MKPPSIPPLSAARQITFHQHLVSARQAWLRDALAVVLADADLDTLRAEIGEYVPKDVQKILAAAGVRDEHVFPLPSLLETRPSLVGYYRLLLGIPQKTFYGSRSGMGPFRNMEKGKVTAPTESQRVLLPEFCRAMSAGLSELVRALAPSFGARDVAELPLLTLGQQIQGGINNLIGQRAIANVFLAIRDLVASAIEIDEADRLVVKNAAGRTVSILLASDPDVRIDEEMPGKTHHLVAIEVKGGRDFSNAHNRAGEAEKSHRKAKAAGFREFWTIIAKLGLDVETLRRESPTTDSWFDAAQVLDRSGPDWDDFRHRVAGHVGIAISA